ncbi:hypothetical protein ACF0H5_014603 [Mactra antiquata]
MTNYTYVDNMKTLIHHKIHVLIFIGIFLDIPHYIYGDHSICSGDSEIDIENGIREVLAQCYPLAPNMMYGFSICSGQQIDCNSLRRFFEVIPSCQYCSRSGVDEKICLNSQLNATSCAVNHFYRSLYCVKQNGGTCSQCGVSYHRTNGNGYGHRTTTSDTPDTADAEFGVTDSYRSKKRCPVCEPCHCEQTGNDEATVTVWSAVGLFFFGLFLGIVITSVVCICVPSLHSKSSILRVKVRENIKRRSLHEEKSQSQQNLEHSTVDSSPPAATNMRPVPSAPPGTGSLQAGYHTLDLASNARDSHMYTGLQPNANIYQEPIEEGDTYREPGVPPINGQNSISSPVYQEPDDVIKSAAFNNKNVTQNDNSNKNQAADGNYTDGQGQRPRSDHHYFVLEEPSMPSDQQTTESDKPYHDYFVLEKEQT